MDETVAVLLAGGLARRIGGGDKPLRLLGGRPLLDHVIERVLPQVGALALNANGDPARFSAWPFEVIADTSPDNPGPLAGILAGMRWARRTRPEATRIVSIPTDTPFLPRDLVSRLAEPLDRESRKVAVASSNGRTHPVIALWPVALADELEAALIAGMRKVGGWSAGHGLVEVAFDAAEGDPFFNVNRPEDLAEAEAMPARRG